MLSKTINVINLESEQQQESHHKTEKSHSFGQGETQDSIWEQLLFEWWISGITNDEWTEYCSDTSTCEREFRRKEEKKIVGRNVLVKVSNQFFLSQIRVGGIINKQLEHERETILD